MKSSLTIIKIVLTVAIIVSIGTALGATIYFGVLKNNPPVAVQPTPPITQVLAPIVTPTLTPTITPNIDTSDWKTYKNEKYGFEFKYPKSLSLEEKTDSVFKSFSVFLKSDNLNGYILINNPGVGTGFDTAISSENILIDGTNSKLQILDSSSDNERAGIVSFNRNNNDFYWLFRFDKSDANKLALIKKTFSTFAFTEKDNITDWKTYRNEKYGFEIKYPKNFYFQEGNYGIKDKYREFWVEFMDSKWMEQVTHNPSLIIDIIKTNLSPKEYLDETGSTKSMVDETCPAKSLYCSVKDVKDFYIGMDKISALRFYSVAVSGSDYHTVVKDDGFLIDIKAHSSGWGNFPEDVYIQTLSTFKFIQKDEFASWKAYRNEEYGFEFKYPNDWFYKETIPQSSNYGLKVAFNDSENKIALTYNYPVPEIGYEAWTLVKTEKAGLFTKTLFKPKPENKDFGNLILADWYGDKFEDSGQFVLNYKEENDPRIKILDQMLSTFKFTEK